jgi:hypothetical protein
MELFEISCWKDKYGYNDPVAQLHPNSTWHVSKSDIFSKKDQSPTGYFGASTSKKNT